jgi:hypothetical protein
VVYFRFQNPTLQQRILYFGFGGLDAISRLVVANDRAFPASRKK